MKKNKSTSGFCYLPMGLKAWVAILAILLTAGLSADDLDDLLAPASNGVKLVDDSATIAWEKVVDAFCRNDLKTATELGNAFLKAEHKTSPYQLLGVRVMLNLANADNPTVTHDVGLSVEMKRLLAEREDLRARHATLQKIVRDADARINKLTANRTQAVQAGTAAYRECARAAQDIAKANSEMDAMKPEIGLNKERVGEVEVGANENLKNDTLKILDMLIEVDEIEAAAAITNVFTRVAGNDLDIAKKQQSVLKLREDQKMAGKLAAAITADIETLLAVEKGEEADAKLRSLIAKVEASDQSDSIKRMTLVKLKVLDIKVSEVQKRQKGAKMADAAELSEISSRLTELEQKLENAQDYFETVVRSIDGFSDFRNDASVESGDERVSSKLREKLKSGVISKEKVDNLIKAKSEHVGILREVEVLYSEASKLPLVQKGKLANLKATAQTALDLLQEATP